MLNKQRVYVTVATLSFMIDNIWVCLSNSESQIPQWSDIKTKAEKED